MMKLLLDMLAKLTGSYNKEPNGVIGRLFHIFAMALWGAQETLQVVTLWHDIDCAQGSTLDRMGRNFGVRRDGAADRFYRLMIKTKITALLSGGDVNTIINATSMLFGLQPEQVEVVELFPAKVRVVVNAEDLDPEYVKNPQITAPVIKRIMAAGVGKEVFFRNNPRATPTLYLGVAYLKTIKMKIPAAEE